MHRIPNSSTGYILTTLSQLPLSMIIDQILPFIKHHVWKNVFSFCLIKLYHIYIHETPNYPQELSFIMRWHIFLVLTPNTLFLFFPLTYSTLIFPVILYEDNSYIRILECLMSLPLTHVTLCRTRRGRRIKN